MGAGSIKGEKLGWEELEHNEVHRKGMEGDDKNGDGDRGRDKDKIEKHAFRARAGKHCPLLDVKYPPNAHEKNK